MIEIEKIDFVSIPAPSGIALRVPDVDAGRRTLERQSVDFLGDTVLDRRCAPLA